MREADDVGIAGGGTRIATMLGNELVSGDVERRRCFVGSEIAGIGWFGRRRFCDNEIYLTGRLENVDHKQLVIEVAVSLC